MEESERRSEPEPGVQTESLSLILSAEAEEEEEEEEEATLPRCASEQLSAGKRYYRLLRRAHTDRRAVRVRGVNPDD